MGLVEKMLSLLVVFGFLLKCCLYVSYIMIVLRIVLMSFVVVVVRNIVKLILLVMRRLMLMVGFRIVFEYVEMSILVKIVRFYF